MGKGDSFILTSFKIDFVDYMECDIPVKDVTKFNKVIGVGKITNKFKNSKVDDVYLPCVSYHIPMADIILFSPHTYHKTSGGYRSVYSNIIDMYLSRHKLVIPIDIKGSNIPIFLDSDVN